MKNFDCLKTAIVILELGLVIFAQMELKLETEEFGTSTESSDYFDIKTTTSSSKIIFENVVFEERRELPMPRNMAVNLHTSDIEIHCSVAPGISKVIWTIEKGAGLSLTGTIYDNGRIRPNWDIYYAMNRSVAGQNSLIILNATMSMAGTYRCATAYPGSDLISTFAEIVVVSIEHNIGTVFSPIMYFKWVIKFCGNMKPHVLCSNGEFINSQMSESRFRESLLYTSAFSGCFMPDQPPLRCSIVFRDRSEKSVTYKTFSVQLVDGFRNLKRRLKVSAGNNMLIRRPEDNVIRVNHSSNIELSCDVHPPPDHFYWAFIDPFQLCYGFSDMSKQSTSFPHPPIKYRLRQRFRDVSQLDLIDVDEKAAGQYRCVITYQGNPPSRRSFSGELVVVLKTSDYVSVVARGGRLGDRLVSIIFRMTFRGNLLPMLLCGSENIKPTSVELQAGIHEVLFNETVVVSYVPATCKIIFENQANRKSLPFEDVHVRRMKSQNAKAVTTTEEPKFILRNRNDFGTHDKFITPKNVIARENAKNVVFHCSTDKTAITVSWEFDGVLQNTFSGLIYQNAKPLPKNVLANYRVNSSEPGQHSLTVLEVKPRTTGTYCCSVRFRNITDVHYRAELVMVTIDEPMTIELLPPGQKWQALFRCVISYYGRMQPFLRCADLSQNMGNKLTTRPGLASVVVFEKYINLSSFPYSCELHFRNSKGETALFETGQTVLTSRFVRGSAIPTRGRLPLLLALLMHLALVFN